MSESSRSTMRPSQIARSTRSTTRTTSAMRRLSMDRDSLQVRNLPASALKRSMNTPHTPSMHNRSHLVEVPPTCEKQRAPVDDKKWIQGQTKNLLDYLATTEGLIGAEFVQRKSFKSITTKQFIQLVSHFLYFACGERFKIGENHVDDILHILNILEYPYQINKSWLKTLTAPHSLNNIIVLLGWLLTFTPQYIEAQFDGCESLFDDPEYMIDPNPDIVDTVFTREVKNKLVMLHYNGHEEEENAFKGQLLDRMTKLIDPNFDTFNDMLQKIELLENQNKELENSVPKTLEMQELKNLEMDVTKMEEKRKILKQTVNDKVAERNKLQTTCNDLEDKISALKSDIEIMNKALESQPLNAAQRSEKLCALTKLVDKIRAKKAILENVSTEMMAKNIRIARLSNQQMNLFEKYNHNLQQLKQFVDEDNPHNVNISSMCLDSSIKCENFHDVIHKCKSYFEECKHNNPPLDELKDNIELVEKDMTVATCDELLVDEDIVKWSEKCSHSLKEMKSIEMKLLQVKRQNQNTVKELQIQHQNLMTSNKRYEMLLIEKRERLQNLKALQEAKADKMEDRLTAALVHRQRYQERVSALLDRLDVTLNAITTISERINKKLDE